MPLLHPLSSADQLSGAKLYENRSSSAVYSFPTVSGFANPNENTNGGELQPSAKQPGDAEISRVGGTLFSYYEIALHDQTELSRCRHRLTDYLLALSQNKNGQVRLVVVSSKEHRIISEHLSQFSFSFVMDFPVSKVTRFLPRSRYAYLDYGVYDVFRDDPSVGKAALQLEENGIFYLGHLVQLTEADLRKFPFMTETVVAAMKEQLISMQLDLGVAVPSWQNTYTKTFGR
jgi:hypothetical protein